MANDGNPFVGAGDLRLELLGARADPGNRLVGIELNEGCDWSTVWVPPVIGCCHHVDADAAWSDDEALFESIRKKNILIRTMVSHACICVFISTPD